MNTLALGMFSCMGLWDKVQYSHALGTAVPATLNYCKHVYEESSILSYITAVCTSTYHGKEIRWWLHGPVRQTLMTNVVYTNSQTAVVGLHLTSN